MTGILIVSTAAESEAVAWQLAESAVKNRLAASAQVVGPTGSVFWHLGELGTGKEWQVLLRTTRERYPDLAAHLAAIHPWDNPEITAVELAEASPRYSEWVRREAAG